ncbi:LuxR C-terminal-related transcriptional regulator [Rubrivivax sp. RP6-9]|uniref:LuxR C-terminal-related transcriptional regulator n=1 Tax=Rubrivivax sp. RP6-9 TaxID=3415750 RepID=UPI003CC66C2B
MNDFQRPIQVAVSHADPLLAEGVRQALLGARGITLWAGPADADAVASAGADVLVSDYEAGMGVLSGHRDRAGCAVLIVSRRDCEVDIHRALQSGVGGYLLAGCSLDELVIAVRTVGRGGRHICDRAANVAAQSLMRTPLTAREAEVLRLMADGLSNKRISIRLDIALGTVKAHTKAILAKLEAASRTEATAVAEQRGLLGAELRTDAR